MKFIAILRSLSMYKILFLLGSQLLCQVLFADPMKPIFYQMSSESFSAFTVQAFVIRGESKSAKIGNQTYFIGDKLGSFEIKDISINKLVISHEESGELKELYVGHRWPTAQDEKEEGSEEETKNVAQSPPDSGLEETVNPLALQEHSQEDLNETNSEIKGKEGGSYEDNT